MSYSDYGSYNWKKGPNGWLYASELEDRSLYGGKASNELHVNTGLKFDAVLLSQETAEAHPQLPRYLTTTSHSIIGSLNGFAVVSYKGSPIVLFNGEKIDIISYDDIDPEVWDAEKRIAIPKANFVPKRISMVREGNICKVVCKNARSFWSFAYVKNKDEEQMGVCGYGLGEHWWLDENGKNTYDKNDKEIWPREQACFEICLRALEL